MLHVKDEWGDVEADEVDFRKGLAPDHEDAAEDQKVVWEQWGGVVERGYPETLVLTRLKPKRTKERAPGPGPMRLKDWQPFLAKRLRGRKIILHTDGARAYQNKADGVIHDNVVHKNKKVTIDGNTVWLRPKHTNIFKHKIPGISRHLLVKGGTQVIDRAWRHFRKFLESRTCRVDSLAMRTRVRSAQWVYWNRGKDLWLATGAMLSANAAA